MAARTSDDQRKADDLLLASCPEITSKVLNDYKPNPKDNLAGDHWFERGGSTGLIGGTGSGKSVLSHQIACALSLGVPILGVIPVHKKCQVLYVQAENARWNLQRVHNGMCDLYGVREFKDLHIHTVRGVDEKGFFLMFDALLRRYKPEVAFVDPYQSYMGDNDINSFEAAQAWTREMEKRQETHLFALCMNLHTGKLRQSNDGTPAYQGAYSMSGTSKISNWLRSSCELTLRNDNGKGELPRYALSFSKLVGVTGVRENGLSKTSFVLKRADNYERPFWSVLTDKEQKISLNIRKSVLAYFKTQSNWETRSLTDLQKDPDAKKAFGCSRTKMAEILKILMGEGSIEPIPGKRGGYRISRLEEKSAGTAGGGKR